MPHAVCRENANILARQVFEFSECCIKHTRLNIKTQFLIPYPTNIRYIFIRNWMAQKRFSRLNSCFSPRFVGVISFKYRLITSENNVSGCNPCDCNSIFFSSSAPHFMLHWRNQHTKYIKILKNGNI